MARQEGISLRDRIVEMRRLPSSEILVNQRNYRTHPDEQRNALRGVLREIGIADALLAYYSERNGGRLTLIDGELRKTDNPEVEWPILITDLNDAEADYLLSTLDPLSTLAGTDSDRLNALLCDVAPEDKAVRELLDRLAEENGIRAPEFQPVSIDEQSRLDRKNEVECPSCGNRFTP